MLLNNKSSLKELLLFNNNVFLVAWAISINTFDLCTNST